MKKLFIFWLGLMAWNSLAQTPSYCDSFRKDLQLAFQSGYVSEIEFHYMKLLRTCGVNPTDKVNLEKAFSRKGMDITFLPDDSFAVIYIENSDLNSQNDPFYDLETLPKQHPFHKKFKSVEQFFQNFQIDEGIVTDGPFFIPKYHLVWVKSHYGNQFFHDQTWKKIVFEKEQDWVIDYNGNGIFINNQFDQTKIYQVQESQSKIQFKKIIEQPGNAVSIPISSEKTYFAITDYEKENGSTSLWDDKGKELIAGVDHIQLSPLAKTIIIEKNWKYQLVDYNLKTLFSETIYLDEIWKNDQVYYIWEDSNMNRNLYDRKGNIILDGKIYPEISIYKSPYAIVKKDEKYGVIDFVNQKVKIPFQNEFIEQLAPGFLYYVRNGEIFIKDENNQLLHQLKGKKLQVLRDFGKGVIAYTDSNGKVGCIDFTWKELIPNQFDKIELSPDRKYLILHLDNTTYHANFEGKTIP